MNRSISSIPLLEIATYFDPQAEPGPLLWADAMGTLSEKSAPLFMMITAFAPASTALLIVCLILLLSLRQCYKKRGHRWPQRDDPQAFSKNPMSASADAVHADRSRIARELHDDIGSTLTSLIIAAESNAVNTGGANTRNRLVDLCQTLNQQINTVIWSLNDENDTLNNLYLYIINYARTFLQQSPIELSCGGGRIPEEIPLSGEKRKCIFLIVKELLNNIVKHAGATQVTISMEYVNGYFQLIVADNGNGFSTDESAKRSFGNNGLKNIEHRIHLLNGSIHWNFEKGSQATILIPINTTTHAIDLKETHHHC